MLFLAFALVVGTQTIQIQSNRILEKDHIFGGHGNCTRKHLLALRRELANTSAVLLAQGQWLIFP